MKLKEKLAYKNRPGFCCSNCKCDCRVQIDAFLAGFEACKKIAIDNYYSHAGVYKKEPLFLGDEEVEE